METMDEYVKAHQRTFGLYLFLRRKELGLSQREVAEKSGVRRGEISEIKVGSNINPRFETLLKLLYALGLRLDFTAAEASEK